MAHFATGDEPRPAAGGRAAQERLRSYRGLPRRGHHIRRVRAGHARLQHDPPRAYGYTTPGTGPVYLDDAVPESRLRKLKQRKKR